VSGKAIPGRRLADSFGHAEFEVVAVEDDPKRPRYRTHIRHLAAHAPFIGYNRAQAAVVEAAVLSTRLHMLDPEKILSEMTYLAIAIGKTAGPREREAWDWIEDKVAAALGPDTADLRQADLRRAAVVIGSEGQGVSEAVLARCQGRLKIPMRERCESLNAAAAGAVVLWEMGQREG